MVFPVLLSNIDFCEAFSVVFYSNWLKTKASRFWVLDDEKVLSSLVSKQRFFSMQMRSEFFLNIK